MYGPPVRINKALRTGEVDAALIGSEEYLSSSGLYRPFLPYGVAASDRIISVRLFWSGSIDELDSKTIFMPSISSTSVRLLKILCHHFWNVRPQFRTFTGDPRHLLNDHPVLVIGDQCLRLLPHPSIDLATSWYEATKKGFIFSLVAARTEMKNKDPADLTLFEGLLKESLSWAQSHYPTIIRHAQRGTHCRRNLMSVYYSTIQHHLTDEHKEGFSLFSSYQM